MKDMRKRFIDMLFEPDDDEVLTDGPLTDVKPISKPKPQVNTVPVKTVTSQPVEKKEEPVSVNVKDVLYKKSAQESAFIDLENKEPVKEEVKVEEYEPSLVISPVFGVVSNNTENLNRKTQQDDTQVKKPVDIHLDIVPSPIFGYGQNDNFYGEEKPAETVNDDYSDTMGYSINKIEEYEMEDELIFSPFGDTNDDFENYSLDDILSQNDDEEDISLFDDFKEYE